MRAALGVNSPAFEQVATQTLTVDEDQDAAVWQATFLPTVDDESAMPPFAPGFLYASGGTLLVYPDNGDDFSRLREGEALALDGTGQVAPVAYGGRPTDFLALELTTADAANTPAGGPFSLPAGDVSLALWALDLPVGTTEPVSLADATTAGGDPIELDPDLPSLIITVGGSVEVTGEGLADGPATLIAGDNDAVMVAGPFSVGLPDNGGDGATVLAVTIASTGGADSAGTRLRPERSPRRRHRRRWNRDRWWRGCRRQSWDRKERRSVRVAIRVAVTLAVTFAVGETEPVGRPRNDGQRRRRADGC